MDMAFGNDVAFKDIALNDMTPRGMVLGDDVAPLGGRLFDGFDVDLGFALIGFCPTCKSEIGLPGAVFAAVCAAATLAAMINTAPAATIRILSIAFSIAGSWRRIRHRRRDLTVTQLRIFSRKARTKSGAINHFARSFRGARNASPEAILTLVSDRRSAPVLYHGAPRSTRPFAAAHLSFAI